VCVCGDNIPGTATSKLPASAGDNDEDDEAEVATTTAKTSSIAESSPDYTATNNYTV